MRYFEDMTHLLNYYKSRDIEKDIVADRLNKSFAVYLDNIQDDYEDASKQSLIRTLQALRRGLKNER